MFDSRFQVKQLSRRCSHLLKEETLEEEDAKEDTSSALSMFLRWPPQIHIAMSHLLLKILIWSQKEVSGLEMYEWESSDHESIN